MDNKANQGADFAILFKNEIFNNEVAAAQAVDLPKQPSFQARNKLSNIGNGILVPVLVIIVIALIIAVIYFYRLSHKK